MGFEIDPRFWSKVAKSGGCWEWTAALTRAGYGVIGVGSKTDGSRRIVYAHRLAYELTIGPIPDGLSIDHLCRNTRCVRPDHLEAVPIGVNVLRGTGPSAVASRRTECQRGHPFDDENTVWRKSGKRMCRECNRMRNRGEV